MILIIVYFNNGTDDGNVDDDNDCAVAVLIIIIGIIINLYNAWSINNCSRTLYQHMRIHIRRYTN